MAYTPYKRTRIGENAEIIDYIGKSTDEKPFYPKNVLDINGSSFYEMDTQKTFFFDSDAGEWIDQDTDSDADPNGGEGE